MYCDEVAQEDISQLKNQLPCEFLQSHAILLKVDDGVIHINYYLGFVFLNINMLQ